VTTTTTYRYRAQTDATIKTWHLGAAERGNVCFCGVRLMTPDDERKFALKVPAEARTYETSDDLAKVTCGACKRSREYAKATAAPLAGAAAGAGDDPGPDAAAGRPSRRRAKTGDPRADRAAAGAGMNEYTAAQLLVDGVQARARNAAAQEARNAGKAGR
jgi:hypothetical protein